MNITQFEERAFAWRKEMDEYEERAKTEKEEAIKKAWQEIEEAILQDHILSEFPKGSLNISPRFQKRSEVPHDSVAMDVVFPNKVKVSAILDKYDDAPWQIRSWQGYRNRETQGRSFEVLYDAYIFSRGD